MPEPLSTCLLRWLAQALKPFLRPAKPGRFSLIPSTQKDQAVKITATLPEKTASDVATFELTYTVDAAAPVVATSTGDPISFSAAVGATVSATFVEIDASGNRSEPSDPVVLVVADTIAPGKPGAFTVAVIGQD